MGAALRPSRFGDGGRPSIGVSMMAYCVATDHGPGHPALGWNFARSVGITGLRRL